MVDEKDIFVELHVESNQRDMTLTARQSTNNAAILEEIWRINSVHFGKGGQADRVSRRYTSLEEEEAGRVLTLFLMALGIPERLQSFWAFALFS